MDIVKNPSIEATFRNLHKPQNWETLLFAKVAFLDKTHPNSYPKLYQLKDSVIGQFPDAILKDPIHHLSHDAFVLLGEMLELDRKKKQMLLSNKNTVAYEHLVIISGTKPLLSYHDPEFTAGLQTLIEALKMKTNLSFPANTTENSAFNSCTKKTKNLLTKQNTSLTTSKFSDHCCLAQGHSNNDLEGHNTRVYEIQL